MKIKQLYIVILNRKTKKKLDNEAERNGKWPQPSISKEFRWKIRSFKNEQKLFKRLQFDKSNLNILFFLKLNRKNRKGKFFSFVLGAPNNQRSIWAQS